MRGTEALLQNTPLLHFSWREEGRERSGEKRRGGESETARGREIQPEPIFLLSASDGAQTESSEVGGGDISGMLRAPRVCNNAEAEPTGEQHHHT